MKKLKVLDIRKTRVVPCGTCVECCKGDAIFMHPECGDDPSQYQTEWYEGREILAHKPNGDCIYLGENGCTIHERRPTICRELDCAILFRSGAKIPVRLQVAALNRIARGKAKENQSC